ncbi:DNA double-strand break repair ATPase Rad50 [Salinicoccus jeotgali]|uniref:Nuclease SbcCD subunit C n=1 Tax=Salinicoccus jeotgali TaxID=381634 RepID=A0ABP7ER33_9STAP
MVNYKIKELIIENFKGIDSWYIDLKNKDLTILDGPNGFGKTSIFDAIELVLTGQIRRTVQTKITDGNIGYEDYLYAKDQNQPIILKVTLDDAENNYEVTIGRKIDHLSNRKKENRPEFFKSTIHLLDDIEDDLSNQNKKESFKEIIDLNDFENTYGLYNYIEQEDSSHFLKRSETERMAIISSLFNIEKEINERNKLEKAKNIMSKNLRNLFKRIQDYEGDTNLPSENPEAEKIEYFKLLPDEVNQKESWDNRVINNLNIQLKETYFNRINTLKYLISNFTSFKQLLMNNHINELIYSDYKIEQVITLFHHHQSMEKINAEHYLKRNLSDIIKSLKSHEILNKHINWDLLYEHFNLPVTREKLDDRLKLIQNLNKHTNQVSSMIKDLLDQRERLKRSFESLIENHNVESHGIDNSTCPLCGQEWENHANLLKVLSNQTELLKMQLDESSKISEQHVKALYDDIINNLVIDIETYSSKLIDDEIYSHLKMYDDKGFNKEEVAETFNSLGIDINDLVYKQLDNFDDLSQKANVLKNRLKEKLNDNNSFDSTIFEESKDLYINTFKKDDSLIDKIQTSKFEQKKAYINYLYFLQSNQKYQEYTKLIEKHNKLKEAYESIKRSLDVYNKQINLHNSEMISEIEVPFFIYTGKILQHYQRGIGVFLYDNRQNESKINTLRFVPPEGTDHDIVHTFSSGQLSATILALTLSLNKVYNHNGIKTLLIDDPVQTMDEMNMVSFIELLKNDFKNYQVILSTHSDQVSLYTRYKFDKAGFQTTRINVREMSTR